MGLGKTTVCFRSLRFRSRPCTAGPLPARIHTGRCSCFLHIRLPSCSNNVQCTGNETRALCLRVKSNAAAFSHQVEPYAVASLPDRVLCTDSISKRIYIYTYHASAAHGDFKHIETHMLDPWYMTTGPCDVIVVSDGGRGHVTAFSIQGNVLWSFCANKGPFSGVYSTSFVRDSFVLNTKDKKRICRGWVPRRIG